MTGMPNKRKQWIDTLKLFAVFIVFLTHFIRAFHSDYASYWNVPPTSWILNGVSGKLCVAFLGVCLGYFAFRNRETNSSVYIAKRYSYFLLCGLFINTLYVILYALGWVSIPVSYDGFWPAAGAILTESILIGDGIFRTFWCMFPFFVSSVLAYINGRAGTGMFGIIVQIICLWMLKQTWIAICLIGALVAVLEKNGAVRLAVGKWYVKICLAVIIFFAVKRPESDTTYLIDGICSGILLLIIMNSPGIQKILNVRFLSSQGKNGMAIFLIHTAVYSTLGKWLFDVLSFPHYWLEFLVVMAVCWTVIVILSYPLTKLFDSALKGITGLIRKAAGFAAKAGQRREAEANGSGTD